MLLLMVTGLGVEGCCERWVCERGAHFKKRPACALLREAKPIGCKTEIVRGCGICICT